LERQFKRRVSFLLSEGHHMTNPEKALTHRHRQILDDETIEPRELHTPEHKDTWVTDFIGSLARVIRNIGGKR
jgi:hypothetical protein